VKPETAIKVLQESIDRIGFRPLASVCSVAIQRQDFRVAAGSAEKHQAYEGGLAVHTAEVMQLALKFCDAGPLAGKINLDVVIAAIVWHDFGKIWDYEPALMTKDPSVARWGYVYTRHRWAIRHLSRSYAEFIHASYQHREITADVRDAVGHAILAHHGPGSDSPVECLTPEALVVHQADNMSARFTEKWDQHIFNHPRKDWKDRP